MATRTIAVLSPDLPFKMGNTADLSELHIELPNCYSTESCFNVFLTDTAGQSSEKMLLQGTFF